MFWAQFIYIYTLAYFLKILLTCQTNLLLHLSHQLGVHTQAVLLLFYFFLNPFLFCKLVFSETWFLLLPSYFLSFLSQAFHIIWGSIQSIWDYVAIWTVTVGVWCKVTCKVNVTAQIFEVRLHNVTRVSKHWFFTSFHLESYVVISWCIEKETVSVHQILCTSWEKRGGNIGNDCETIWGRRYEPYTSVSMAHSVQARLDIHLMMMMNT